jgi:hypothetical protein
VDAACAGGSCADDRRSLAPVTSGFEECIQLSLSLDPPSGAGHGILPEAEGVAIVPASEIERVDAYGYPGAAEVDDQIFAWRQRRWGGFELVSIAIGH